MTSDLQNCDKYTHVTLSHYADGNASWQPWKTNASVKVRLKCRGKFSVEVRAKVRIRLRLAAESGWG